MAQPFMEPGDSGVIDAAPSARGREITASRRRIVLAVCGVASAMAFIDEFGLTVALPRLRAGFGADLATVQWVLNGYVLALAALALVGGSLADVYGKSRMLVVGYARHRLPAVWRPRSAGRSRCASRKAWRRRS